MNRQKLLSAIDDAIGFLPPELGHITADYLQRIPHAFATVGSLSVDVKTKTIDKRPETTIAGVDTSDAGGWTTIISETSLSVGSTSWTVEFERCYHTSNYVLIAVGVTTKSVILPVAGTGLAFFRLADQQTWLIFPHPSEKQIYSAHQNDYYRTDIKLQSMDFGARFRVDFNADPETGRITATVLQPNADNRFNAVGPPIVLITASTARMFDLLRPAVVVGGNQTAVIRSGS